MAKKTIEFGELLAETVRLTAKPGALLVSVGKNNKPNVMTIGWGLPGVVWGRPIFAVLVRPSRYTYQLLEERGEFTVNLPYPEMADTVMHCGTVSGRDHDKFREKKLTLLESETVKVPCIDECGIHYECRVVQKNDLAQSALAHEIRTQFYAGGDFHRVYYGEVLRISADDDFQLG